MIGALREALFLGPSVTACSRACADAARARRTLTVTEKGYCHDPATGALDLAPSGHRARPRAARRAAMSAPGIHRGGARRARRSRRRARSPSSAATIFRTTGAWSRGDRDCVRARRDPALARLDRRATSRFPRRWSIASCRRRRRADIAEAARCTGVARCRAGRVRAVPAVGDRGSLRRAAAGVGGRRARSSSPTSRRSRR